MKFVYQTILKNDEINKGNCLQASIASLFELSLDNVPHFAMYHEDEWSLKFTDFIYEQGYLYEGYAPISEIKNYQGVNNHHIVMGTSKRGYKHAVVYKNNELIHDPHPEGGGLIKEDGFLMIKKTLTPLTYNPWRLFL
jgi:hypothetical protein